MVSTHRPAEEFAGHSRGGPTWPDWIWKRSSPSTCTPTCTPTPTATWRWTTSSTPRPPSTSRATPTTRRSRDIAADYRAKNMAAVVFTVDTEMATGQPALSNEEIADLAAEHPDVLIPFGSIDPARGAVRHPAGPQAGGVPRGARVQVPPVDPGLRAQRPQGLPAVRGAAEPRRPGAVPHRPDRHRRGPAGRPRDQAALLRPDAARRRRRRLPRPDDHHGPPVGALAGRGDLGGHPQGERLHRPVRLVAEVLPAAAGQGGQRAAEAQGAVRLGLPAAAPRALDRRLRAARHQARGQAADHEGERDPGALEALRDEERRPGLLARAPAADLPAAAGDLVRGDDDDARRVRRTGSAGPPPRWRPSGCSAATGWPGSGPTTPPRWRRSTPAVSSARSGCR